MPKAIWNATVIAQAREDEVEIMEGNVYFPIRAVNQQFLQPSERVTHCNWKGAANYYHIVVNGNVNPDAAWTYCHPFAAAGAISNHIAFWRGVVIES